MATKHMFGDILQHNLCVVMTLQHANYPQWHPISCNQSLPVDVICVRKDNRHVGRIQKPRLKGHTMCAKTHILFHNKCYLINRKQNNSVVTSGQVAQFVHFNTGREMAYTNVRRLVSYLSSVTPLKLTFKFPASADINQCFTFPQLKKTNTINKYRENWHFHKKGKQLLPCTTEESLLTTNFVKYVHCDDKQDRRNFMSCASDTNKSHDTFSRCEAIKMLKNEILCLGFSDFRPAYYNKDVNIFESYSSSHGGENNTYFVSEMLLLKSDQRFYQMKQCKSGELISAKFFHDGKKHCSTGDDEETACHTRGQNFRNVTFCRFHCKSPTCKCGDLFFQNIEGGCLPYANSCGSSDQACAVFIATKNSYIHGGQPTHVHSPAVEYSFQSKFIYSDCTEEELYNLRDRKIQLARECKESSEFQCSFGCMRCYPVYKVCVYELDTKGYAMHCPSGAHLKMCHKIGCNNMLKCPKSYCIPYRYLCFI